MKAKRILIIVLVAICLHPSIAQHKAGALIGVISDLESMETIPFANIVIKDSKGEVIAGGASDFDGHFNINPIEQGEYIVEASFTGYDKEVFKQVRIKPGEKTKLDILMVEASYELIECVITCNLPEIENTRSCCITTCCGWSSSCYVFGPEVDIDELGNDAFALFPNPSYGEINLKSDTKMERVVITNMNGQQVAELKVEDPQELRAHLNLPDGIYLVHLSDGASKQTQKWVVR